MNRFITSLFIALAASAAAYAQSGKVLREEVLGAGVYLGGHALLEGNTLVIAPSISLGKGSETALICAEDVRSGNPLWSLPVDGSLYAILAKDGVGVALTQRESVVAFELATGTVLWSLATKGGDGMVDRLFFGGDGALYFGDGEASSLLRLDLRSGKELARLPAKGVGLIDAEGNFLGSTESQTEPHGPHQPFVLRKWRPAGEELWAFAAFRHPSYLMGLHAAPGGGVLASEYVSASHPDPALSRRFYTFGINARGNKLWELETNGYALLIPMPGGSAVAAYVRADKRTLEIADPETGVVAWAESVSAPFYLVDVEIDMGRLTVLSGNTLWSWPMERTGKRWSFDFETRQSPRLIAADSRHAIATHYDEKTKRYSMLVIESP